MSSKSKPKSSIKRAKGGSGRARIRVVESSGEETDRQENEEDSSDDSQAQEILSRTATGKGKGRARRVVDSDSDTQSLTEVGTGRENKKGKKSQAAAAAAVGAKKQQQSQKASAKAEALALKLELKTRVREMINEGVLYFVMATAKKVPIKRADFTRIVCRGEKTHKIVKKVLSNVQRLLDQVFGVEIYALNESSLDYDTDLFIQGRPSFIVVSQVKSLALVKNVVDKDEGERGESLRATLFIILTLIFMQYMEAGAPEGLLWTSLTKLKFTELLNLQEKDFTKFLKMELVSTYYLRIEESKDEQNGAVNVRYTWGPRAHLEFSKLDILMQTVKTLGIPPTEFPKQVQMILDSDEKPRAVKELKAWAEGTAGTGIGEGTTDESEEQSNTDESESDADADEGENANEDADADADADQDEGEDADADADEGENANEDADADADQVEGEDADADADEGEDEDADAGEDATEDGSSEEEVPSAAAISRISGISIADARITDESESDADANEGENANEDADADADQDAGEDATEDGSSEEEVPSAAAISRIFGISIADARIFTGPLEAEGYRVDEPSDDDGLSGDEAPGQDQAGSVEIESATDSEQQETGEDSELSDAPGNVDLQSDSEEDPGTDASTSSDGN